MSDPIPSLADARRLVEGATDGPWEAYRGTSGIVLGVGVGVEATERSIFEDEYVARADAEFIAASRTLVPALLAAVEGVLALEGPFTGENSAQDYMRAVRAAITAFVDIESR